MIIDPDCRDGKCDSCVGEPCEHWHHILDSLEADAPQSVELLRAQFKSMEMMNKELSRQVNSYTHELCELRDTIALLRRK